MGKSNKDKIKIEVVGGNCESVTGSCTKIDFNGRTVLVECGMIQDGHTPLENYVLNQKMMGRIKHKNSIDLVFVNHFHLDHIGLLPMLYKNGCRAKLIIPQKGSLIFKEMLMDSARINQRDAQSISYKKGKVVEPLYGESDVLHMMEFVKEYPPKEIIKLDDEVSFRFISAGHVFLSYQMELFIRKQNNHVSKILFTSDLGNVLTQDAKVFVDNFEPVVNASIVIGESTYGSRDRIMCKKDFEKDMLKIKAVIEQYCVDTPNRVLIPTFSYDRMPFILWLLYITFVNTDFDIDVCIDSPLSIRLLRHYSSLLEGEAKEKFDTMMAWDNIRLIESAEDSKAAIRDNRPKVVLSSSGMMTNGRCVKWTQDILSHENDCILFIGYAGEDTLAYKVKHGKQQKTISINGKPIRNKAQIVDLKSFSSHMQHNELIKYYSSINCEKIYLVHGDMSGRIELKEDLIKNLSNCSKTTKVVVMNHGTEITL